jgi:hypothetical protein
MVYPIASNRHCYHIYSIDWVCSYVHFFHSYSLPVDLILSQNLKMLGMIIQIWVPIHPQQMHTGQSNARIVDLDVHHSFCMPSSTL